MKQQEINRKDYLLTKKITLFLLVFFCSTSICLAEEAIQPFGGIQWRDNVLQIATKIKELKPDTISLVMPNNKKIDIYQSNDSKAISANLGAILKESSPFHFDPEYAYRIGHTLEKYFDADGNEKVFVEKAYAIEASPIMISGVPFRLVVIFTHHVGLAVTHPENVYVEPTNQYTFPLIIESVNLTSKSPALADKYDSINKILDKKYKKFDPSNIRLSWPQGGGQVFDGQGNSISINATKASYTISYSSDTFSKQLNEKYRQHLVNLEAKKMGKKDDMANSL